MAAGPHGQAGPAGGEPEPLVQVLTEDECLRLVMRHEVGRIAYDGRFGPAILPVNYRLHEGSIVFRTGQDSALEQDLRTGIADAEYKVAFVVDELDARTREGWSVLIQGSAHHVTDAEERAMVARSGVTPWAGGAKEQFIRVRPTRITGRRITRGE